MKRVTNFTGSSVTGTSATGQLRSRSDKVAHPDLPPLALAVKRDAKSLSREGWRDGELLTCSHLKEQRMLRAIRSITREEL